jgi:dihydroorotase
MKTLLKNIQYLDPDTRKHRKGHLVMENRKIAGFTQVAISDPDELIDGQGYWVFPGFIDLHVHFREPGGEKKETLESGAEAAVAGGYTTVVCMPNTSPVLDHREILERMIEKANRLCCNIRFMGGITRGLSGRELVDFGDYDHPSIVGVTDDGRPVMNARLMMEALLEGRKHGLIVADHCEEESLMYDRSVNQGAVSAQLGLAGVPALAEELMVQRNIYLASVTGCNVHIQHVSTAGSVELIRQAKANGISVTAEATPHHFSLTESAVLTHGSQAKMSPPLRTAQDMKSIQQALADGTIDCIATDHAPHAAEDKTGDLITSANGIIGLETAFGAAVTHLLDSGAMKLPRLIECLSTRPAGMLGLSGKGSLKPGSDADVTLVDLRRRWTVSQTDFRSKSTNTPFEGLTLRGKVTKTLVNGVVCYEQL